MIPLPTIYADYLRTAIARGTDQQLVREWIGDYEKWMQWAREHEERETP